jgi:tetratricopeptide (TPR) repeat protein
MLGTGWLTLRQIRAALQNGRLEEAQQLLNQPAVRGHKKSWDLLSQLTRGYVQRGERLLQQANSAAAWDDLGKAEGLAPADTGARNLREGLIRHGVAEVRELLESGEPRRALETVARLGQRGVQQPEFQNLEDVVKDWVLAQDLADRGEFTIAEEMFGRVRRVIKTGTGIERFEQSLRERQGKFAAALPPLHEAVDQRRWRDVLHLAENVLAVAPQYGEAKKARARAWKSQEPETLPAVRSGPADSTAHDEPTGAPPKRFLLWIDGIGGYLVCLGAHISFGQVAGDGTVDVPLLADVSRLHATLTRDAEGYVIESTRALQVNGQSVPKALLRPGDRVTLGAACQFLFQVPVPLSTTARLELVSGHRLPLSVDGILLMAETLILGPGPQSHVPMPDLGKTVVLYRHRDGLGVRFAGEFRVNGEVQRERGALPSNATVSGPDFSFAVEPAMRVGK